MTRISKFVGEMMHELQEDPEYREYQLEDSFRSMSSIYRDEVKFAKNRNAPNSETQAAELRRIKRDEAILHRYAVEYEQLCPDKSPHELLVQCSRYIQTLKRKLE